MSQTRVIIRVCVTDIPGEIGRRPNTLGRIFCEEVLHRNFQHEILPSGFDSVHIPPGFDSQQPIKRWFVCDLNVVEELDKDEVAAIPHRVYQASLVNGRWIFTPREIWAEQAKQYASSYCYWGGRTEQAMANTLRRMTEGTTKKARTAA